MFSSIATAPAKQSVSETITVLSGRLSSATLLEDRRAAILGLRSFAKEYPASVASGALRSLIGSLSKDGEDVDTVKVVLETLLMLFDPNPNSPEASEEIALWLADEFSQHKENVTLLLDFLETNDFYSRLYSLQLLAAILSARTDRTEECILTAGGIPRLVPVLDDRREAVRNEALSLLIYLTPSSPEIKKQVAMFDVFERIFAIISAEGGLSEGDRIVEDCLILLANLLRLNAKNQEVFRELGCSRQLSKLLESTCNVAHEEDEVAQWAQQQRNRNTYALLAIIRLFLVPGADGTLQNQAAFWEHRVIHHALQLAFSQAAELPIRAEALTTCADIIRANPANQESFVQLQVPSVLEGPPIPNGQNGKAHGPVLAYVIDGLLELTLCIPTTQAFDLRLAACECLKAYFFNHREARLHFLRRAIDGHNVGGDEATNVLTTLLQDPNEMSALDPYRYWFASVIMFHLIYENAEAKALAMKVTEGDVQNGGDAVTCIQSIAAHLIRCISRSVDERVAVGYLMLLIGWLFEDLDGVNDFLGESSNVTSLAKAILHPSANPLVQGLCAMILGVVYEFSTKDSPISRATLRGVLIEKETEKPKKKFSNGSTRITRELYGDTLNKLRSHPLMRDFEVTPQKLDSPGSLPDVFFDSTFVDFFKDNYSRILRGIDRDPGMEISVITNGVQKGISRELVDSLRSQIEDHKRALQTAEVNVDSLKQQLVQEQVDHRRSTEASAAELARIKSVNEALQHHHEEDVKKIQAQQRSKEEGHQRELSAVRREAQVNVEAMASEHRAKEAEMQRQLEYVKKTAEAETARVQRRADADIADLRATISRLEVDLMKVNQELTQSESQLLNASQANKVKAQALQALREEHASELAAQASKIASETAKAKKAEEQVEQLKTQMSQKEEIVQKTRSQLNEKDEEKAAIQTELDDLLMVFGDLEEKVEKYKASLLALGGTVTDGEDEDDDEDEDEEENEVD
ncbi:p115 like vesicle tethering protein [Pseudomassariella vexata]|uniref:p115 like vesicle tethering protein n=1 Tax=Pseudomassariella vexata TaxID=1141098 RepID=A0A1Y2DXL2_9PEZI|nr:p115 like vesicle tethering protein [Pseudomassariella vexata]ORY63949.1 p115 like vesicle tethering protein [Pseudomassariella vexata]